MGSRFELNDILQITTEQGFPARILDLAAHAASPIPLSAVAGTTFAFHGKPGARLYQYDPTSVGLVHNIGGRWLFWGRALIQGQSIDKALGPDGVWVEGSWATSGTFRIVDLYEPAHQRLVTSREAPAGKDYVFEGP